jgi:hypothetical protein
MELCRVGDPACKQLPPDVAHGRRFSSDDGRGSSIRERDRLSMLSFIIIIIIIIIFTLPAQAGLWAA